MKYTFKELVDVPKLQALTDGLYAVASTPSSIVAMDGEVLTGSGWQKICTNFHRKHPQIEKECIESDTSIRKKLAGGEPFVIYKCPRGLVDASAPIIIAGEHVANVFSGQVFLEPPDETTEQFFREQAHKFGFDETEYIKAFKKIPIFTEKKFRAGISFLAKLAQLIADMGLTRLKELEAMETLRESEDKFRSFAEQSFVGIYFISDGLFKYVNPKFAEIFGYSVDECLNNMHFPQLVHPQDLATVEKQVSRRVSGETKAVRYSFRGIKKSGETIHVEIFGSSMVLKGKTAATGTMLDITEPKRAQEALLNQQYFLQKAQEIGQIGTWELDIKRNELLWTDENYRIFGLPIGTKLTYEIFLDRVHPDDREYVDKEWKAAFDKKPYDIEHRLLVDGKVKWVREKAELHFNEKGECIRGTGVTQDVTARKQVEEALRESEKQLSIRNRIAEIFLTIPDDEMYGEVLQIVLECMESPYGTFAYISEDGDRIVPSMTRDIWDECKMLDKDIFFPRDTWGDTLWARCLIEKKSFSSNGPFKIPDGHMPIRRALATPIIHKGESIGNLMVGDKSTDYSEKDKKLLEAIGDRIAPILHARLLNERNERERNRAKEEKKQLQNKLHRAQKMQSLGLMAGGIAHDLNNILSGIVSYPELLLMDLSEDSPLRKPIKTIQESGMRAADVVEDLLTVARGVATGKDALNLNALITQYLGSAEYQKLERTHVFVNFKTELDPDLLNMSGSPVHIKKTLMNLVVNASEAIEGDGTVTISTMNHYLDEPLKGYEDVRTGEYAVLSVSDNGSGVSPKDLEKIFEPFYTKKVMGRSGTGLGLAVVWNTVQDHNGYINVKSSEEGTVFELYFPVTRAKAAAEGEEVPLEDYLGHGEKILVVDDEERQREIACGMLIRLGYNAEAVSSGEDAIEYVKEQPVDLIVLDMVMPKGINGRETYEKIIKIRPGQKAIIASGFSETEAVKMAQKSGAGKYIKKPYILEKIGLAVKEELGK